MTSSAPGASQDELLLLPYTRAVEMLNGRNIVLAVVAPPYPAIGRGTLRVARVSEDGDTVHLDVTYDDYERLA